MFSAAMYKRIDPNSFPTLSDMQNKIKVVESDFYVETSPQNNVSSPTVSIGDMVLNGRGNQLPA
jgi:hypothetical protein